MVGKFISKEVGSSLTSSWLEAQMNEMSSQHTVADHHGKAFSNVGLQLNLVSAHGDIEKLNPIELGSLPLVSEVDPVKLAVHRSSPQAGSFLPAYVKRDIDDLIDSQVRQAVEDGGFVLVVGESTAGKSRATYESLLRVAPSFRLFFPETKDDILGYAIAERGERQRSILWIEDLDRYISPDCLTPAVLRELVRSRAVIVSTMRSAAFRAYQPRSYQRNGLAGAENSGLADVIRMGQNVLNQTEPIILDRKWSSAEIQRARKSLDSRVLDAASHSSQYGVSEYLAAGPQLLKELKTASGPSGNPRGASIVLATIDLARAGLYTPIPTELIFRVHEYYLNRDGGSILRPEAHVDAMRWATELRHGVTSFLIPTPMPGRCRPFDYLVDEFSRDPTATPVPDIVWSAVLDHAAESVSTLFLISVAAIRNSRLDVATKVLDRIAGLNDTRLAAYLGVAYSQLGSHDEAERWLRISIQDDNPANLYRFGIFLESRFRLEEAAEAFKRSVELGYQDARIGLGLVFEQKREFDSAEDQYRLAYSSGVIEAAGSMGRLLAMRKKKREAEQWLRRGFDRGSAWCGCQLGGFLVGEKRQAEAIDVLEKSLSMGHDHAASELGKIYARRGDLSAAESWFAIGSRRHDPAAMCVYADFLAQRGKSIEAISLFQKAFNTGHTHAGYALGELYELQNDMRQAINWHQQAAEHGNAIAACRVGHLLLNGSNEETKVAIQWLRVSVESGHSHAGCTLGRLFAQAGGLEDAERFFTIAMQGGHDHAREELIKVFNSQGRISEVRALLRAARAPSRASSRGGGGKAKKRRSKR